MSVNDFIDSLSCSEGDPDREWVRAAADCTVRLTVGYTSQGRPDGYPFSGSRGTSIARVGTGLICDVYCDGQEVRKYWRFHVRTAQHVVYDTEEAKRTRVDLFYDDETSRQDRKVVTVWALMVDWCDMECVTHDERIGEMVESLDRRWHSLYQHIGSDQSIPNSILLDRLRDELLGSSKKSSLSGEGQVYTRVDLFYDDETSRQDGKVVSVWALRVFGSNTESVHDGVCDSR